MMKSVSLYAPTVTCLRSDRLFTEQDQILRKAARIALHAAPDVRNEYIMNKASLQPSKDMTIAMAARYSTNDARCPSVKQMIELMRHG